MQKLVYLQTAGGSAVEALERRLLCSGTLDIVGVQAVSLDQPRIHALFRTTPTGDPLVADSELGETFNVEMFLDTGTSQILISQETSSALGIDPITWFNPATQQNEEVLFGDVGIAGSELFHVSDPLYAAFAPYTPFTDVDNIVTFEEVYSQTLGPARMQLNPHPADGPLPFPLDIAGMPAIDGRVMVLDPRLLNMGELETIRTYLYEPGTPYDAENHETDPGIPQTERHVQLSFADFSRFTQSIPAAGPTPALTRNPMIGPDPVRALDPNAPPDNTPGITIGEGARSRTGSFLFDTGAQASFISRDMADAVGVEYAEDTYGTDDARLIYSDTLQDVPNQYTLTVGGIGGSITVAGFKLDTLDLPTDQGALRFHDAPVLVVDVELTDPATQQTFTLDGDLGMNYLVTSASIVGGFPDEITAGAFDWVTFDTTTGQLGLSLMGTTAVGAQINDGHRQRSMVRELTVTFDQRVSLASGALELTKRNGSMTGINVAAANPSGDGQTFVLTFSGSAVTGGSLPDGIYDLTIHANLVTPIDEPDLIMPEDAVFEFHRLYSDADGDGDSDNADLFQMRAAYGKFEGQAGYVWYWDYEDDNDVDNADVFQVRSRRSILFKGY